MGIEIVGMVASVILLIAYYMVTTERWERVSLRYQGLNVVGTTMLIVYGAAKTAYASVLLNVVWVAIGLGGLYTWYRRYRAVQAEAVKELVSPDKEDML